MPSWVEELAWAYPCPTCQAQVDEPCFSRLDPTQTLEFNHPSRNELFHDRRQQQRESNRTDGPDRGSVLIGSARPGGSVAVVGRAGGIAQQPTRDER